MKHVSMRKITTVMIFLLCTLDPVVAKSLNTAATNTFSNPDSKEIIENSIGQDQELAAFESTT